jgi:hypothetical protein
MALPNTLKLFIDPKSNVAYPAFDSGTTISNPSFYLGDTTNLELYLIDNSTAERKFIDFPAGSTIKCAVGDIDTPPSAGTFTLTFGANTTSALAYNISAADLQTALNALASVTSAGGVTVSLIGNNYSISFNSVGARTDITANGAGLVPLSAASITILQQGTSSLPEIALLHLQTLVAGYTNSFTAGTSPSVAVSTLSNWGTGGLQVTYKLTLTNVNNGTFSLTYDYAGTFNTQTTSQIPYNVSASELEEILNTDISNLTATVSKNVNFVGQQYYITFRGLTSNYAPASVLGCDISGIGTNPGVVGDLALNTTGAIALLGGSTAVQTSLAVQITNSGKTQTVYQTPCVLYATVIDEGIIAPTGLDTYVTLSAADSRYMLSSAVSGFTFPDSSTQASAAYTKAYVDSNLLTKAAADGYYTATGTALLKNGSSTMAGNLAMGGYNITGTGTVSATYANFTTANVYSLNASNSITVGGTSAMTYSANSITFTDASVQTVAYPGTSALLLKTNNLSDLTSQSTARTNLGLGTMAVETATNYVTKANNLSGLADYSTARNNLGLGSLAVYADAPADSNYYVRRNNAWVQAVVYTTGGKNYLTIA